MSTPVTNRIKLLRILNNHFAKVHKSLHLEDRQVRIVVDAMEECQSDSAETIRILEKEIDSLYEQQAGADI